jgi:sulfhydrogenase subunit beta (sulfur reductase)
MEQYKVLKKADFKEFIGRLAKNRKLVAPVKRGDKSFAFAEVKSGDEIALKYIPTILPPKKYFLPQSEVLAEYDRKEGAREATLYSEETVVFGVHTCDLAGIQCLNLAFLDPADANYNARKKKILLIGLECNDRCDEYSSCGLMKTYLPNGGYDLFFTELSGKFLIHVNTQAGDELVKGMEMLKDADDAAMKELAELRNKKQEIFKPEIGMQSSELKPLFENSFQNDVWKDIGNRCLSCANCTNVCPTCYCYDMEETESLDGNKGQLVRKWDSCQSRPFAMVAGGENFRSERGSRQRHRYMRKFNYPYEKYGRYFCTGCGRCSRTCMAKINLKETIETLNNTVKV